MARAELIETIETVRLRLAPLALSDAAAMINGHRPERARWVEGYPTDGSLVSACFVLTAEAEGRALGPWTAYQIARKPDGAIIGDSGFLGPPDHLGHVHLGYGIAEVAHHQAYATEALTALIAWARNRPEVTRILADTAHTNQASIRVMEGAGMRRAGSDGEIVYYEA